MSDRELGLEEIEIFVSLVDRGAGPLEYYYHFGFKDENIRWHLGRISGYRAILEDGIADIKGLDPAWAEKFCSLVDKGAGLRGFRSLGIHTTEAVRYHTSLLDKYRKAIKLAQGIRIEPRTIKVYSPNFIVMSEAKPVEGPLCSLIVIGTTLRDRQARLKEVVESFNQLSADPACIFAQKIISIDDFGDGVDIGFLDMLKASSWHVIVAKRRGMVKSQRDALHNVTTPWVLYCEDDAKVFKLPTRSETSIMDEVEVNGRRCGILSFFGGGYDLATHNHVIDGELREPSSYIELNKEDALWVRSDRFKNHWFVEFPIAFMRTQLMKNCSDFISNRNLPYQIEHGYTEAWFGMNYDKNYFKASYMKHPKQHKPLSEYSYNDITHVFIEKELIHGRLLGSYTIHDGHNFCYSK